MSDSSLQKEKTAKSGARWRRYPEDGERKWKGAARLNIRCEPKLRAWTEKKALEAGMQSGGGWVRTMLQKMYEDDMHESSLPPIVRLGEPREDTSKSRKEDVTRRKEAAAKLRQEPDGK